MSALGLLVVGVPRSASAEVETLLSLLPARLAVPVALVLHREPKDALAGPLARRCPLPVVEPDDKEDLVPGRVHLAPTGYHLLVDRGMVVLSCEPSEHGQRPAIDALFESAADAYGPAAVGVLFAGHEDGWAGLAALRARGGHAVVVGEGASPEADVERIPLHALGEWLGRLSSTPRLKVEP